MAITVTFTGSGGFGSGGTNADPKLRVLLFSNQNATPIGGTGDRANTQYSAPVTIAATGSFVVGSMLGPSATSFAALANTTILDNIQDATNNQRHGSFISTALTSSTGSQTFGSSATWSTDGLTVAAEIKNNGSTLTRQSGSEPAVVSSTTANAVTTASFTPTAGWIVVALVDGLCTGGSVTDSSGMTWTSAVQDGTDGYAEIFYAVVPASGANVNLTTPNLALAAPLLTPGGGGTVALTAPNLQLDAPLVTPAASGTNKSVALTTPNVALAAPLVAPAGGKVVALTTPNVALAAPVVTPKGGGTVALTTPNLNLRAPSVAPPASAGTFPDSPLGVMVELNANGWQDISPYVAHDSDTAITITSGRADGSQTVNPSTAAMKWSNQDARFSPRNPIGPYYGSLGKNTPVRVSIPSAANYLRFADDTTSFASTPDSVGLSITGSIEIQIDLDLQNYTPTMLLSKSAGGSNNSWNLSLQASGKLRFEWSVTGSNAFAGATSIPVPVGRMAWKITLDATTATTTFYTAPTIAGPWTQFGASGTFGAATSIHDSTAPVAIGGVNAWSPECAGMVGRVYAVNILSGIGGTAKASPDFTLSTPGAGTLTDAQGNVWTLNGTAEFSGRDYKFHGECAALPQDWSRDEIWTPVSAAGVLRRINQNNSALDSPMKRGYMQLDTPPIAYWPAEDGANSTQIAAAIGGQPMKVNGTATFASNSDFLCSAPIPVLNASSWSATVPQYSGGTDIVYRFLMEVPLAGETDGDRIARIHTSGTVRTFTLFYKTGGSLQALGYDASGTQLFDSGVQAFAVNGEKLRVSMELRTSGGNVAWSFVTVQPGASGGLFATGTVAGTVGHATQVYINPNGALNDTAIGHISVENVWASLFALGPQLNAFQGEAAGDRFARLCTEENLNYRIYGPSSLSRIMGAQPIDLLSNILQECEDADQGMMFEPLDIVGLGYRTSGTLCAQDPAVSLDYSLDHLSPPLSPTDDDQYTQNDITATRPAGSSARQFLDDGSSMSISNPPVGVGSYTSQITVNVNADSMLNDNAGWLLHLGTVDEERYPEMKVDLAATSPAIVALFDPVLATRLGDLVSVDNLPPFLPPNGINALVWGSTLVLGDYVCNVTWQTQPASPYDVLIAGSGAVSDCRADTSGSTLHASATSAATSITVDTQAGSVLWTTVSADWPFDILVGGERMTVTHISGTSNPQTFTVTRHVNGVVKSHSSGEAVSLFDPYYYALS